MALSGHLGNMHVNERERTGSLKEIFTRDFLLISTINLALFFGFQMTNVGLPVYVVQLGANPHIAGLVGTVMTATAIVVRVFAGPLLDRFGRKGALVVGSIVMAASIFSYAIFPIVGVILGVRMLQGLGWGLSSTACSTTVADVIPKRRFAEGMGYFTMTNSFSSAIAPAAAIALAQGPNPEHMIYVAGGCATLAFVLALVQHYKVAEAHAEGKTHGPAAQIESGLQGPVAQLDNTQLEQARCAESALGERDAQAKSAQAAQAEYAPREQKAQSGSELSKQAQQRAPLPALLSTVFERRAALPGLLILVVNIGFGCITSFVALHAQEQGIGHSSIYFITYAIVTLASRPLIGRLIDRYGYRTPSILATLGTACTLVLIGLSTNTAMLACAGVLAGLGVGTAMNVYQAMAVAAVEPQRRGVATSTYFIGFDSGIAIGSLVGGFIANLVGYSLMYMTIAAFPLAACLLSAALIRA